MFDTLMSGRYDWILFPLGLVVIALFVIGLWLDFGEPGREIQYRIACETAAMEKSANVEERLAACQIEARGRASPSPPMAAVAKDAAR
jgi:hypothetical protein